MEAPEKSLQRYTLAVESLVEKLQQDRMVLAAILCGSLSWDVVWEKSDIDVFLVGDEKVKRTNFTLTEEGIVIHAYLVPRSQVKQVLDGGLQSSFLHSLLSRSRLLYTHDEAIRDWYDRFGELGRHDRQVQLLSAGIECLPLYDKARKWFFVKKDYPYTFLYILFLAQALARVEVIQAGQITGREVIHQALALNPDFFRLIYTDLMDLPKTEATIGTALEAISAYLEDRTSLLFQPVLDYLEEAEGPRGTREINDYFQRHLGLDWVDTACDYLVERGMVERVGIPLRLTDKSRASVEEAGYVRI
ncbi:MAG: hypothetical protein OHK0029_23470 [Armatimonadaceae bacterium]